MFICLFFLNNLNICSGTPYIWYYLIINLRHHGSASFHAHMHVQPHNMWPGDTKQEHEGGLNTKYAMSQHNS